MTERLHSGSFASGQVQKKFSTLNVTRKLEVNITVTILDIIHRPVFYLKHDV
jgi:hypothetical protein